MLILQENFGKLDFSQNNKNKQVHVGFILCYNVD